MYSCSMLDFQLVENCFIDLQADNQATTETIQFEK